MPRRDAFERVYKPRLEECFKDSDGDSLPQHRYEEVLRSLLDEKSRLFKCRYDSLLQDLKSRKADFKPIPGIKLIFVPGFAYKTDKTTGADFKKQEDLFRSLGIKTQMIELDEVGRIRDNAERIAEFLGRVEPDEEFILISGCKGGPEALIAIDTLRRKGSDRLPLLRAWINIGGLLKGTYLASQAYRSLLRPFYRIYVRWYGLPGYILEDLSVENVTGLTQGKRVPEGLTVVNVVGVPAGGRISGDIRTYYNKIKAKGINDGYSLITDTIYDQGINIFEIGLDHFFRDEDIDLKILAIYRLLALEDTPMCGEAVTGGWGLVKP